jgi:hypothetical protein
VSEAVAVAGRLAVPLTRSLTRPLPELRVAVLCGVADAGLKGGRALVAE